MTSPPTLVGTGFLVPRRSSPQGTRAVGGDGVHLLGSQVGAPRPRRRGPAARLAWTRRRHPRPRLDRRRGRRPRLGGAGRADGRGRSAPFGARGALRRRLPAVPGASPAPHGRRRVGPGPPRRDRRRGRGVPRRRHPRLHRQRPGCGARRSCERPRRAGAASPSPPSRRVSCSRSPFPRGAGGPWGSSGAALLCFRTGRTCPCGPGSGRVGWPVSAGPRSGCSETGPSNWYGAVVLIILTANHVFAAARTSHAGRTATTRSPSSVHALWPRPSG